MANRSYIWNTATPDANPWNHLDGLNQGIEFVEIADASNRIPVPWLCCFRGAELDKVSIPLEPHDNGFEPEPLIFELPWIEVSTAQKNLQGSLHIFQELTGDLLLGEGYWDYACRGLVDFPLPYLVLNPIDVFFMNDPLEEAEKFARCLREPSGSMELIKHLSFFNEYFPAFPAHDFYTLPFSELNHQARLESSRALDAAYLGKNNWYWHRAIEQKHTPPEPPVQNKVTREKKQWWRLW